jgi:hypothetical protein
MLVILRLTDLNDICRWYNITDIRIIDACLNLGGSTLRYSDGQILNVKESPDEIMQMVRKEVRNA